MIHSIGSLPRLAGLDCAFSCFLGFSGYLSSGLGLLCCAAPGSTNRPNPRHNAKDRRAKAQASLHVLKRVCEKNMGEAWWEICLRPAGSNEARLTTSDVKSVLPYCTATQT